MENRLLLGLRGPVLRSWSAVLEIAVEAHAQELRLLPLDDSGTLIRKHFMQLDGLGVGDLHVSGHDLYILAGPTMVRTARFACSSGPARRLHWPPTKTRSASRPHWPSRSRCPTAADTNRAEAICDLPAELAGRKPSWLVLYDAHGEDRMEGEHKVFGDLLRRG